MSDTSPNPLICSPDIVGGLIETVTAALLCDFPSVTAVPDDIELVLEALRVLCPKLTELDMFEGLLCMQRGLWDDAIYTFQHVIANAPNFFYAKPLMAACLSAKGDGSWRRVASEALNDNPNGDTQRLVRALHARDELSKAIANYQYGGKLEIPLSVAELGDNDPQAQATVLLDPAPSASGNELVQPGHLRI